MKMEITGKVIPSAADAITPINIIYHSGAAALTTRHAEGSGRALSRSFVCINDNKSHFSHRNPSRVGSIPGYLHKHYACIRIFGMTDPQNNMPP